MVKKLIKETIVLQRDGKRVVPPIGKAFNLTADEIKEIEAARGGKNLAFEDIDGESDAEVASDTDAAVVSGEPAKTTSNSKKATQSSKDEL